MLFRKNEQDERITAQRRQIGSEGFYLILGLLLVSITIKPVFFNIPIRDYWTEFAIFMAGAVYVTLRHVFTGSFSIVMYGDNKKTRKMYYFLFASMLGGALAGLTVGIRNYLLFQFSAIYIPLVVFPVMFTLTPLLFATLVFLDRGSVKRADKMADDE